MGDLLMKNGLLECHILWGNLSAPKKFQHFFSVEESKHVVRAFVAETLPSIRIDVIHHKRDICL